jgi:DNA-binding NarL/FixJ family response regulator
MSANQLPEPGTPLTRREKLVLAGLARGLRYAEIAQRLGVSTGTVERDRRYAAIRMGCPGDRSALVAEAYRRGLLADLPPEPRPGLKRPTARRMDVLLRLADGMTYPQIAAELGLTTHTIRTTVHHLYQHLGVRSRAQAVAVGVQYGLIAVPPAVKRPS